MTSLEPSTATIVPSGVVVTATSLSFNRELRFEEWDTLMQHLLSMEQSVQWWLGDMLLYGEAAYGEKYAQAATLSGRSINTLANWVYISKAFPQNRRRESVRWSCYRELAPIRDEQEQDGWLDAVEDGGWTREELRFALRENPTADSPPRRAPLQPKPGGTPSVGEALPEVERISWTIRISVPETSDLMVVQETLERSAKALEVMLAELRADPEVGLAVDVSG